MLTYRQLAITVANFLAHPLLATKDSKRDQWTVCTHQHWSVERAACPDCGIRCIDMAIQQHWLN